MNQLKLFLLIGSLAFLGFAKGQNEGRILISAKKIPHKVVEQMPVCTKDGFPRLSAKELKQFRKKKKGSELCGVAVNKPNKEGKQNGVWVSFYENGIIQKVAQFQNGKQIRNAYFFSPEGQLTEVHKYTNGKGKSLVEFFYHPNGNIRFMKDLVDSVHTYFNADGDKTEEMRPNSKTTFYLTGDVKSVETEKRIVTYGVEGNILFEKAQYQSAALNAYDMEVEVRFHPNGFPSFRRFSNGKEEHYDQKVENQLVKRKTGRYPNTTYQYLYRNGELYQVTNPRFSDKKGRYGRYFTVAQGKFDNDTLVEGQNIYYTPKGEERFKRGVHYKKEQELRIGEEVYNQVDSIGRKQGVWLFNNCLAQTWENMRSASIYGLIYYTDDKIENRPIEFRNPDGELLYRRRVDNHEIQSAIELDGNWYNVTNSQGEKQGIWLSNVSGGNTWLDGKEKRVYHEHRFKSGIQADTAYSYYEDGKIRSLELAFKKATKPVSIQLSKSGNVIARYYRLASSGLIYRNETFYDTTFKRIKKTELEDFATFKYQNNRIISRTTVQHEAYYSMEEPGRRRILYTVAKGTFRQEHLYNGIIRYYDKRGQLLKEVRVVNGRINGDPILVFTDPIFELDILKHCKAVDKDKNGYIQRSEALAATELYIHGLGIEALDDLRYFKNLEELYVNTRRVKYEKNGSRRLLLDAIQTAASKPRPKRSYHYQEPEPIEPEIVEFPPIEAEFPGGWEAFYNYVNKELKYPELEKENNIRGKVYVEFEVSEKGEISSARVLRGISPNLDREAVRLVRGMPNWSPAKTNGKSVRSKMVVPIDFRIPVK